MYVMTNYVFASYPRDPNNCALAGESMLSQTTTKSAFTISPPLSCTHPSLILCLLTLLFSLTNMPLLIAWSCKILCKSAEIRIENVCFATTLRCPPYLGHTACQTPSIPAWSQEIPTAPLVPLPIRAHYCSPTGPIIPAGSVYTLRLAVARCFHLLPAPFPQAKSVQDSFT